MDLKYKRRMPSRRKGKKWWIEHKKEGGNTSSEKFPARALALPNKHRYCVTVRKGTDGNESKVWFALVQFSTSKSWYEWWNHSGSARTIHRSHLIFTQSWPDLQLRKCKMVYFWWKRFHCHRECPNRSQQNLLKRSEKSMEWIFQIIDWHCIPSKRNMADHHFSETLPWTHDPFYVKQFFNGRTAGASTEEMENTSSIQ